MQELSVGMRTCLGHKVVSYFPSLASSFLFSMSYMECLKDKMLFGWGKLDTPIKGEREQLLCGRATRSRGGRSLLLGMGPGTFHCGQKLTTEGTRFTLRCIQLATKV